MTPQEIFTKNLKNSIQTKQTILAQEGFFKIFEQAATKLIQIYKNGGRLYIAGNGGSAADSQHLAAEFVSKLAKPRAPLPAEALSVDTSAITAIGNDFGFEFVFSRQLEAKAQKNDAFLGITTSGQSPNILKAFEVCKSLNIPSFLLTGKDGGPARRMADYVFIVPSNETQFIQEAHISIYHSLCEAVESALFQ